jgi:hypothetical protein
MSFAIVTQNSQEDQKADRMRDKVILVNLLFLASRLAGKSNAQAAPKIALPEP